MGEKDTLTYESADSSHAASAATAETEEWSASCGPDMDRMPISQISFTLCNLTAGFDNRRLSGKQLLHLSDRLHTRSRIRVLFVMDGR
jgi:hypothetical protein